MPNDDVLEKGKKFARDLQVGDRVKLGHQWRRLWSVQHHTPASDEEIAALVRAINDAHAYSFDRLAEAARDLAGACLVRQKWSEPHVLIKGGSATSIYEMRLSPDAVLEVKA